MLQDSPTVQEHLGLVKKKTRKRRTKKKMTKKSELSRMIREEAWLENPLYQTEATQKLLSSLREIEKRKPLAPGKNPDPTANAIL
jgi:hypothetical protein